MKTNRLILSIPVVLVLLFSGILPVSGASPLAPKNPTATPTSSTLPTSTATSPSQPTATSTPRKPPTSTPTTAAILPTATPTMVASVPTATATKAKGKPTATNTPTVTNTPTITNTPTVTFTPTATFPPTATFTPPPTATPTLIPVSACTTTSSAAGGYSVTLCFDAPASGSVITGDAVVSVSATSTGAFPGIQRMVFYLNGQYLITDYQSSYTFNLPSGHWLDGVYSLQVEALLRDATVTQQAVIDLTFNNGVLVPPVNNRQFSPSSGSSPAPGDPFLVAAAGDGASGELNAVNVTNLLGSINPNLFVYLGDVYEKGSPVEFYNWYGPQGYNFGVVRSITNPTIGNHEYENGVAPGYFDYWDNIPNYYSYDAGGWHFISLNSNSSFSPIGTNSVQYQWLQQDLAANANKCTIAYFHHPLFNIGPEGSTAAIADAWNLMAQNGVSIVLNGHDHTYQRWLPLDGTGQPSASGITEFVAGASGHGLQTIANTDSRVAYAIDSFPDAFGLLKLKLNAQGAAFSYVNINGLVLDSGVIPCLKTGADTQAPSVPTLSASVTSATRIDLSWSIASDNTGVKGYTIYRDGAVLATVSGETMSYADKSAMPSTSYIYTVDAFDLNGNHSAQSNPAGVTTPEMPRSLTFITDGDAYVNESLPTSVYGSATVFRLLASPDLHGYVRFTVEGLANYPVARARLLVYANNNSAAGINAFAVADNSWSEKTLNYSNMPALGAAIGSSGAFLAGNWVTVDVTPYITSEGTYTFGLTTASTSTLSFSARESGVNAAQLIVEPAIPDPLPPTAPSGLSAAASSATRVDLNWQASTDNVGVTGYTIYRDNIILANVSDTMLAYSDTTAVPTTSYTYTVDAVDAVGNHSDPSAPVFVTMPDMPASLTYITEADTYVNASFPTTNYGTATVFRLLYSPDLHGYLRFTVSGLAGYPVSYAKLRVYTNNTAAGGITAVAVADNSWGETSVNYNNAPSLGAVLSSSGPITAGSWVTLDVTPYVTGEGTYSFALTTPGTSTLSFNARESGVNAAQLIVEPTIDSQSPSTPLMMAVPVSATEVDLSWQASIDNTGVTGYTIYRDGNAIATVPGTTLTYADKTVLPSTTYTYTIAAFDYYANHSSLSDPAVVTTPNMPASLTFVPMADTYVNATSTTTMSTNYGSATVIRLLSSPDLHGYLRFTVQGLLGYPVVHARLMLFANTNAPSGITAFGVVDNSWGEKTINYTNAPPLGSQITTSGAITTGTWVTLDVTPYITGEGTYSFGLTTPSTSTLSFNSKEATSNPPQLIIDLQ